MQESDTFDDILTIISTKKNEKLTTTAESTTEITNTSSTPTKVVSTVVFFDNFDPATFITCIVVCIILTLIFNGLFHYISSRPRRRPHEIDAEKQAEVPRNKNNTHTNVRGSNTRPLLSSFTKKLPNSFKSNKLEHIEMDRYSTKPTSNDPECIYDDIAGSNGESKWPPPPPALLINGDGYDGANHSEHNATRPLIPSFNLPEEDIYDDIGMGQNNSHWQNFVTCNQSADDIYDDIGNGQTQDSRYIEEEVYDDVINLRPHRDSRNDDRNTVYEPVSEENVYANN